MQRRVDVIYAEFNAAAAAALTATTTVPIVFSVGGDPVALGLVSGVSRPEGNLTGASFLATTTMAKMAEVVHEAVPTAPMAALINPANPTSETEGRELQNAARVLGAKLDILEAGSEHDIDESVATLIQRGAKALIIQGDPLY